MYYLISVEMYCIFSLCTSDYPIKGYIPGPAGYKYTTRIYYKALYHQV